MEDDWSVMLTSLVVWASEPRRLVITSDMAREAATVSIFLVHGDPVQEDYVFLPMEASLTMGYVY
jgi:hypothetical protein